MNRSKYFAFVAVSIIVIMLSAVTRTLQAGASNLVTATPSTEEEQIKNVIQAYFEIRYRAFNTLQLDGFGDLLSNQPEANAFLDAELGKLAVEIKHAALNHLKYMDYEFFLNFKDITIDEITQTATASFSIRHDVIYEISMELDPANPIVSHMYNLEHTIILHKEQGQWKIVSDDYTDYLWRMLRQTGISTDEMLSTLEASPLPTLRSASVQAEFSCNLPVDASSHAYNRQAAVDYALAHIPREAYNPDYPDYNGDPNNPWGDCTNFVSQAMYEGGNVSMAHCDQNGPFCTSGPNGNIGWFFTDENFRASAWTDVGKLHEFITDYSVWTEGPEGCDVNIDQLALGDIIQYKWDGDEIWDHAVIVVDIINGIPYVASHSEDVGPVPYTGPDFFNSFTAIRFIHIERSDGLGTAPTLTPTLPPAQNVGISISQGSDDGGTNPGDCAFYNTDNEVYLGTCFGGGDITSGFRFQNVQIPRNANIESAYLNFTVDGTYINPIQVRIYGEASGSPLTYSQSSPPVNRLTTSESGSLLWTITGQWGLGEQYNTPDVSSVIREIINRPDWNSGQPISIIIKNAGSTDHRRVIAFERVSFDPGLSTAQLVVTYNLNPTPIPTATPINSTPLPVFTPTSILPTYTHIAPPTSVPTNPPAQVPWICRVCGIGCPASVLRLTTNGTTIFGTPTPYATTPAPASSSLRIAEALDLTTLLHRVRDEILSATPEGQRLTDLYNSYIPNIVQVLMANPELSDQSLETMNLFIPSLQALLDGNGDTVSITSEQVTGLQSFLNALVEQGDPELQGVILSELERRPLDDMVGMTMDEAWSYTNGYQLEWLPPISNSNPYSANQGSTIPVKFTITDFDGNFVVDESLTLQVLDFNGNVVVGPIQIGSNPNTGIKIQGSQYHYNLKTKDLIAGTYTLHVTYNASDGVQTETWPITLTKKK